MSQPGQPGQDVPDELLKLAAELLSSWYGQDLDFTDEARTLLAAVLPAHEAMVRVKVAEEARQNDGGPEIVQVCMHEVMLPAFKAWLAGRDLHMFPIPVENDLPTYGISIGARGTS